MPLSLAAGEGKLAVRTEAQGIDWRLQQCNTCSACLPLFTVCSVYMGSLDVHNLIVQSDALGAAICMLTARVPFGGNTLVCDI